MGSITPKIPSTSTSTSTLFQPLRIGTLTLSHRIILAPLTRYRSSTYEHVPLPYVPTYYNQRAALPGTLQISEATFISPQAGGLSQAPGIWNAAQIDSWKRVTCAVHHSGSKMFMQLWALGRAASLDTLRSENGADAKVVGPSAIPLTDGGDEVTPLTESEIEEYVRWYGQAARNAIDAGFDGVELHGANGYLLDQFTQDVSNTRTDSYGGSVENRARFPLMAAKAAVDAVGADRVAYRISPFSEFQNMKMADPVARREQFSYLVKELRKLDLAYLHVVESRVNGAIDAEDDDESMIPLLDVWSVNNDKPTVVAGGYKGVNALEAVETTYKGRDVAVAFGRYFISNPDLAFRIKEGIELEDYDRSLFYNKGEVRGYTDWPFSREFLAQQKKEVEA